MNESDTQQVRNEPMETGGEERYEMSNDVNAARVEQVVMRCESCGGTSSVPRHGLDVCATCLHGKAEVRLMATDVDRHNAWVDELKADVEFEPLRDFLDRLKEASA